MDKALSLVETAVLTPEEKTELDAELDRIIEAHKANRKEINRLVFESVAAMTEADEAGQKLASKGFWKRIGGSITGSNKKLQDKINASRAAAQYASQQTLQKLAEQNLLTFDLLAAVNNKLNASMKLVGTEFTKLYTGLEKFFQYNQSQLVRMELRLAKVEKNVNLLNWQNSIEYLEWNGDLYPDLDDAAKIVCLARDFCDITKGEYGTSDLLLLKASMDAIGISPRAQVNYGQVLEEIAENDALQEKLFGGKSIRPIADPGSLIAMSGIQKLNAFRHEDKYLVDTVAGYAASCGASVSEEQIGRDLTKAYLKNNAGADVDMDVDSFDMVLDLIYGVQQADVEGLLLAPGETAETKAEEAAVQPEEETKPAVPEKDEKLVEAEKLFWAYKLPEAYQKFKELAEAGNGRAMYYLGLYAAEGYAPVAKDEKAAREWWEHGFKEGDALAAVRYAVALPKTSIKRKILLEKYASQVLAMTETNDSTAQWEASRMYKDGFGTEQNLSKMAEYLSAAAEEGFWLAACELGRCYEEGTGVEQDAEAAVEWYTLAAEAGYAEAQHFLGQCFYDGKGIGQSFDEAASWFQKAADQNYIPAQNSIGECYYYGNGVAQDYIKAVEWFQKAAEQGYAEAQYNLGYCYRKRQGVPESRRFLRGGLEYDKKAVEWYQKAADQNYVPAYAALGDCYYGDGTEFGGELREAAKWYRKGAELGNAYAQYSLGYCYLHGKGVDEDYDAAKEWFQKAAAQGNESAKEALENM